MPGTLLELAARMESLADRVPTLANERAKAAGVAIVRDLAHYTLADTSTALSNWKAGVGSPDHSVIEAHSPGQGGSTRGASAEATIAAAEAVIASKPPGAPLYISNAVSYIGFLNDGTEYIVPQNYADRASIVARDAINNYVDRGDL